MIKFQFAELVNEDGSVRRLPFQRANLYREKLKTNLSKLAEDVKDFPDEPSHLGFNSTQLNRHLRSGETPTQFLSRAEADGRVQLTPFLRWRHPELRGGNHFTFCQCLKRNGLQMWCPRWGCRGSLNCLAGAGLPGVPRPRQPLVPVEPLCCESWRQRAKEADLQLHLLRKTPVEQRGLY